MLRLPSTCHEDGTIATLTRVRPVRWSLGGIVLLLAVAPSWAVTVDQIPSPRPDGWSVDLARQLPRATLEELNRIGDQVKDQTGGELAVVVVDTIGGAAPRAFATQLFNKWGIGRAEHDDGVLIFVALRDRAAEIVLGDGVDDAHHVRASEEIMQRVMVPRFRAGDPAGAVLQGTRNCAERILGARLKPSPKAAAPAPPRRGAAPGAPRGAKFEPKRQKGFPWGWLVGGGVAAGAAGLGLRQYLRYRPRRCPTCGQRMTLLGETSDDEHLKSAERTEERIGSVDYDIWHCAECDIVLKLRYGAFFTQYSRCPKCRAETKTTVETTIRHATYSSGGRVRVEEKCVHCKFRKTYTRSTPRLQRSSSSSDSSSYSSSSSSSSGSSFGGGSSSGSGASGRW